MTPDTTIYHLKGIQHYYGDKRVLDIDDLKIERGSITGLVGANGSGKTTLLKTLAFVQKPTTGEVLYNGKPELPFSPSIRSKVTLLTQTPYLLKRTIFENIAYGLKIRKDTRQLDQRIAKVLSLVGLEFDRFAHRMWHELSGGEAQRVAMAARLILKPQTLLLDEPVASVDVKSARLIRNASLKARDKWGTTLVIASHDLSWLFSVSDHQISVSNGKLFSTGVDNIIPGPFARSDTDSLFRQLDNGQRICLSPSNNTMSTAVIKKEKLHLTLARRQDQPGLNQLDGKIRSLHHEKKQNWIMAHITIADLTFELSLTRDQVQQNALFPGQEIVLSFKAEDIEWI